MPLKLVFIDDETAVAHRFIKQVDEGDSVEVQLIRSAPFFDAAIEGAIGRFGPHLIVLDLFLMQNLESGFRILRKLKASKTLGQISVVVYSDWIGRKGATKARCLQYGACDAISKSDTDAPQRITTYARDAAAREGAT